MFEDELIEKLESFRGIKGVKITISFDEGEEYEIPIIIPRSDLIKVLKESTF